MAMTTKMLLVAIVFYGLIFAAVVLAQLPAPQRAERAS